MSPNSPPERSKGVFMKNSIIKSSRVSKNLTKKQLHKINMDFVKSLISNPTVISATADKWLKANASVL